MSAKYWSRMRKHSRAKRAVTLHFTRHPDDVVIRVARANRAAHDIILVPEGATDADLYHLVRDYTRDLSRLDLFILSTNH